MILNNNKLDDEAISAIDVIDKQMIKEIMKELRSHGPFDLVDVSSGDGTRVKVSIL